MEGQHVKLQKALTTTVVEWDSGVQSEPVTVTPFFRNTETMPGAGTELLFPDIITNSGVIGHEKQNLCPHRN